MRPRSAPHAPPPVRIAKIDSFAGKAVAEKLRKPLGWRALQISGGKSRCRRMPAAAENSRERRQIDLGVGAAAEAHALAAQIEERDHGARLALVERGRDFAAVAEAAGAAHL